MCACVRARVPSLWRKGKSFPNKREREGRERGSMGWKKKRERERVSCYGGVLLGVVAAAAAEMDRSASSFDFALLRELLTFARVPVAATTSARLAASTSYSSSCVRLVSSSIVV